MTLATRIAVFVLLAAALGCGDDENPAAPTPEGVRFGTDVQPIFTTSCTPGCHSGSSPNAGLDLGAGVSHGQLVGVPALNYPGRVRVVVADPEDSVLYLKLLGDPSVGNQMPLNPAFALDSLQVGTVRRWIADGARND